MGKVFGREMIDNLPKIRGSYRENFQLANVTWFGVGGKADILFKPEDVEDLAKFLREKPADLDYMVLGVGSNLLVRDGGIRGTVIRLGREFTKITHEGEELIVGAGALDVNVSKYCLEHSLAGLEFLSGIPGVIGAAIAMNAGAYGDETANHLIKVEALDQNGNLVILSKEDCGFKYRGNSLNTKLIFTKAYFKVTTGDKKIIQEKIANIQHQRESSQPIRSKTGGSTFKNPSDAKAWALIDQAGCRGMQVGDAVMSSKHCNFLINLGTATAKDIEELGEKVRKKVFENSGIMLEWEIKIVGSNDQN